MNGPDDRLESALARWLDEVAPASAPADLRRRILNAADRTQQRSRWGVSAVVRGLRPALALAGSIAAIIVVVGVVGMLSSVPRGPGGPSVGLASPTSRPTPTARLAPSGAPIVASFPDVSSFPIIALGSVWAPQWDTGSVLRIDLATNEVLASIPVGERPHAMAVRGSEIWVSARDDEGWAVIRLDPETNEPAERIEVGDQGWGMSIVGDTMWLTSFESSRLIRIDLVTRQVTSKIRISNALGLAASENDVWIAMGGQGTLARLDPAGENYTVVPTGTRTTTIPLLVDGDIWVSTLDSGEVVVISAETAEVVDRIALQFPMGLVQHAGLVWVTDDSAEGGEQTARVVAIDIASRQVVREVALPGVGVDRGIVAEGNSLWLVGGEGLLRLDITQPAD